MSMLQSFNHRLSAIVAAGAVLIAAAPAQAAVIASFDPAFGPSIPNVGFRGSITLDVTAGCYQLGSGFQNTGGACQITPLSAQINYYDLTTVGNPVLTTVDLAGAFFAANYVFGAYFDPLTGQLAGLDTSDSSSFGVSVPAPVSYTGSMLLYFQSGFAPTPILFAAVTPSATVPGVGGAYLVDCNPAGNSACTRITGTTSNPGRLVFTTVPEPDSIALAMLGLGALAFNRRRRATDTR